MNQDTFETFKEFIESNLGIRIPQTKKIMLESRLAKRLRALKIPTYEEYCAYVFSDEGFTREIQQLIDVVTTNETDFFRESHHYDLLEKRILLELIEKNGIKSLNVWSVAASTGQEAYTIAMVLEDFRKSAKPFDYSILGTDISETVLRVAHAGIYTERQAEKIPSRMKKAYCLQNRDPDQKTIRIKPSLREHVRFRKLNLMDSVYQIQKKYHIVFCRNVFIYFDKPTQLKVLERIYSHMAPGGYLFMGHSENLGNSSLPLKNIASAVYRNEAEG